MDLNELFKGLPSWLRDYSFSSYISNNYVVIDYETTILDKGSPYNKENSIVCSSFRYGRDHPDYTPETTVIKGSEYEQQELVRAVERADFFIAHNAKFEYGWLQRCGIDISKSLAFCTQIAEYVLRSNRRGALSLNACLKRRKLESKVDLGSKLLKAGVCPSTWPDKWLIPYSKKDVEAGEQLFLSQRDALVRLDKLKTAFTRNIFTPVLVDIESRGMHLDKERVIILHRDYTRRLQELQIEVDKITGGANPNSPKQMREVLYEKLKFALPPKKAHKLWGKNGETPTTSFDYINTLKPRSKRQVDFKRLKQEYSKVNAALTKSLNKFYDCVNETEDHILTASLNQTITKTQRLSSSGKNYKAQFQNFPRIFKPLFSAQREGWSIGEIDQAQLEYRVAVFLGQDEAGLYDITHEVDAHAFTASHIFGRAFDEANGAEKKDLRTEAKSRTFKPLYGGESGTPAEKKYYKAFKDKHKGVTTIQTKWKQEALSTQKMESVTGLTFYYPGTRMDRSGYIKNSTNICNYPVQSLATADIVPIGVTYQWHLMRLAKLRSYLINTIHDSSIGEVHPEEKEIFAEIGELSYTDIVYIYLKKIYNIDFNVPLAAEIEFNKNWADNKYWRKEYLHE